MITYIYMYIYVCIYIYTWLPRDWVCCFLTVVASITCVKYGIFI